ncbi:MAG: MoaD/ThiS family protein [Candidatus Eisenbacteria bacterium]|nr:MoaD/ThiS family protein [Candidatus Eisenbacteria bacterium]
MKVKISFGESVAGIVGQTELEIDFEGGTLEDLLRKLGEKNPRIAEEILSEQDIPCTLSVNDEVVIDLSLKINDGDRVYMFLPVAGG